MSSPSREDARDRVDLRTGTGAGDLHGHHRLRTLAEKLAVGTATVGVFGLDPIGLEFLVAAGGDGAHVVAVDLDPELDPAGLPMESRQVLAALPEVRIGHQPTALLAADVVIVSMLGAPDPAAAASGLRAGQLLLMASSEPAGDGADAWLDTVLEEARIVREVDVRGGVDHPRAGSGNRGDRCACDGARPAVPVVAPDAGGLRRREPAPGRRRPGSCGP